MAGFRSPIARVRGLGSAREGTEHFWRIRLSSVALIPLTLFFVGYVVSLAGAPFAEVREALANPLIAALLLLFILASLDHMRLGMQEIIEDYVHGEGGKYALLMLNTFFTWAVGAASVFAVLKLAFGG
jgi:succinate dehydrogenase / fumarate reductase, membrane anchor subunit